MINSNKLCFSVFTEGSEIKRCSYSLAFVTLLLSSCRLPSRAALWQFYSFYFEHLSEMTGFCLSSAETGNESNLLNVFTQSCLPPVQSLCHKCKKQIKRRSCQKVVKKIQNCESKVPEE